jgi:TetR/AcrR family transcriptional regulator
MRLSTEQRRRQVISAAMRLFSSKGFDGTSTREIAQVAGINEALIFRHFQSKEDLYWAVVSSRIEAAGRQEKIREYLRAPHLDAREVLAAIAENLLDRTSEDADLTRLLLFSALRNSELSENFFRTYMAGIYEALASFIRKEIGKGQFRKIDPMVAARGFMGMISSHILLEELLGGSRKAVSPRILGRQMADLWLNGISLATSKDLEESCARKTGAIGHDVTKPRTTRKIKGLTSVSLIPSRRNGHRKMERNR